MSDDDRTTDDTAADAAPDTAPETAPEPAPEPAADTTPVTPEGGMAAGWYPAEAGRLRYFDGTVWTGAVSESADATTRASFGEKFRRRLPIALLVITALYLLLLVSLFSGDPLGLVGQSSTAADTYKAGMVVGAALGVVVAGLFWGAVASALPGKHKEKGLRSSALVLVVAIVAAATVGALVGVQLTRTKTVEVAPIASPAEGCQKFLDTFDTVAQKNLNNNEARPYFTGLADAARANDPALATDLDTIAAAKDQTSAQTAVQSILTRCVTDGHVTEETLTTWLDKIQSYGN